MEGRKASTQSLREIEAEVLAEGREWTRRRLEERLQEIAAQQGEVFPPRGAKVKGTASAGINAEDAGGSRSVRGVVRKKKRG